MKIISSNTSIRILIVAGAALAVGCQPTAPPPQTPMPPSAGGGSAQQASLHDRPIRANAAPGPALAVAAAAPSTSDVIARLGTKTITKDQLLAPMIKAHGLSFLLHLAQLELARQACVEKGLAVTPADVKAERDQTLARMFKESDDALRQKIKEAKDKNDNDAVQRLEAELKVDKTSLLDQYLVQEFVQSHQYVSRQEFDLVMEMNAHLRKVAEANPEIKKALTDEMLRKAFGAQYGEKVVIRHIQAGNIADISEARRHLQAGESFADVAMKMSKNATTAPQGGAVRPFTASDTSIPQIFKDTAFALKVGEVSETIQSDGAFHILKLENRIAPKVVKFEDVKEAIRANLYDQIIQASIKQLRDQVSGQLLQNLQIENPELKAQFAKRMDEGKVRQQAAIDNAMRRDRLVTAPPEKPTTAPASDATPASK